MLELMLISQCKQGINAPITLALFLSKLGAIKPGLHCDISISTSINISSVNRERHKHKHKHNKHNKCSHLLHKHKESDIRKRNKLQNEAMEVWGEARFQNGGRRNSPAAFAALQMPDTFLPTIFLSRLHLFPRACECLLTSTNTKGYFICNLEII